MKTMLFAAIGAAMISHVAMADPETLFPVEGTQVQVIEGELDLSEFTTEGHGDAVYVLEFFSTRCGWCQANSSYLEQLAIEYADDPRVKIIGIGIDQSPAAYGWWFSHFDTTFPILIDYQRALFGEFGVHSTPTTLVFDCEETKHYQHGGFLGLEGLEALRQAVNAGLEVTCAASDVEDPDVEDPDAEDPDADDGDVEDPDVD